MDQPRTWTAKIEVRERGASTTIDASLSDADLLRDQVETAVRESCLLGVIGTAEVEVVVYKTTRARGTERDRSYRPFLDGRGVLRYDGPYA